MGVDAGTVDDDANLIGLGMDSIRMMRLAGGWRRAGAAVTFRELAEDPTVTRWHALLTGGRPVVAEPVVSAGPVDATAPFDLTPVQRAYWIGRQEGMALGGVGCHAYLELDGTDIEPDRLERAVRRVLERHEMLRARFTDEGRQLIQDKSPWPGLTVHDLTDTEAEALRSRLSHRVLDVAAGEVFDVQLSRLPEGRTRVHVNIDLLVADVASIELVLTDLARAYRDPEELPAAPAYGFAQYLQDYRAWCGDPGTPGSPAAVARDFWRAKLPELPSPGPKLPLAVPPTTVTAPRFSRRTVEIDPTTWDRITQRAREHAVTPATVLATAYAEVLGAWSEEPRFLLNVPLFDRQPLDPAVGELVADFTNLVLLAVDLTEPLPFADRARTVQSQLQQNASHAQYSTLNVLQDLRRAHRDRRAGAPVVFACNLNSAFVPDVAREELGEWTWMLSQTPQVWLDHQVYKVDGALVLAWDAVDELFPEGLLTEMLTAYDTLLRGLVEPTAWQTTPVIR
ncbi:hypothetical protein GCM10023237_31340 [Streptomyces coeruleoprunus]